MGGEGRKVGEGAYPAHDKQTVGVGDVKERQAPDTAAQHSTAQHPSPFLNVGSSWQRSTASSLGFNSQSLVHPFSAVCLAGSKRERERERQAGVSSLAIAARAMPFTVKPGRDER
ncbi:hypothetical protein IAQ61_010207 [Plenodomus lingam]|uniref:uncharacterized protein n=1 Tax=Leptosphaeria maculans TaxID=5022 RepID=UPI00333416CC|nr:hypothetical protein IAQ61_010207 [Plenodomus lingam]